MFGLCCSEVGLEVPFKLMHPKPDAGKQTNKCHCVCFIAAIYICSNVFVNDM